MTRLNFRQIALIAAVALFATSGWAVTGTASLGKKVELAVTASGTAPFSYQWFKNNTPIPGAFNSTYTIASVAAADAGTYTVGVTNSAGSTTSDVAVLNVDATVPPPAVSPPAPTPPAPTPPTPTPAPPAPTPTPPPATPTPPVSPTPPTSPSPPAPPPAAPAPTPPPSAPNSAGVQSGRLINVSVRGLAGRDSQTLIVGFIVSGAGNLPVLIRGWGPELAADPFNVPGALQDPILRTFSGATQIAENDNWGSNAQTAPIAAQVGAFPFPSVSKDAAIFTTFTQGAATSHITSVDTGTGVSLAEVFDASSNFTPGSARLTNVSARAHVGTGANVLIGGFVIGGGSPIRVLIRAIGPTLGNFGVGGLLADPKLELHSSAGLIASNDNWSEAANAAAITADAGAHAFALPTNSKDAVILTTLPPGAYSAIIKGVNDTAGTALLEVYEVP